MSKILIAYFSHAGQNYSHGGIKNLKVGNTEVVAKKLHVMLDSDLFYIDTVQKYPDDHMQKIAVAKREYEQNARPELTAKVENMGGYDTVILAFPNWWTTMPMALFTFLESYDFSGKTICPLITHGGSGFSNSLRDIAKLCPNAKITEGLAINGDYVSTCDSDLEKWVKKNCTIYTGQSAAEDCIECGACSAHCEMGLPVKDIVREMAMLQGTAVK